MSITNANKNTPPNKSKVTEEPNKNGHSSQASGGSPVVAEILDEALESEEFIEPRIKFRHPIIVDLFLTVGLLVATGGFTLCLLQLYVTHTAQQCLIKHDYKSTIALLSNSPFPGFFNYAFGEDPREILSEALYLDAMNKVETQDNTASAVEEMEKIPPNSKFFDLAQKIIGENTLPSPALLRGSTSIQAQKTPLSASEKLDNLLEKEYEAEHSR
jgi:hypothetical protein